MLEFQWEFKRIYCNVCDYDKGLFNYDVQHYLGHYSGPLKEIKTLKYLSENRGLGPPLHYRGYAYDQSYGLLMILSFELSIKIVSVLELILILFKTL